MAEDSRHPQPATTAATQALERGDARAARELFSRAIGSGAADADTWFGLSVANRRLGLVEEERSALDRTLQLNGRYVPALIRKGDLYASRDDLRAAASFYRAALQIASSMPVLAPELRAELARAQAACEQATRRFEQHLVDDLTKRGLGNAGTERFGRAVDLLLGKRQIFLQQPQVFYFPELPQVQFYDKADFSWVAALEQETDAIRDELRAVLARGSGIEPYMQREPDRPVFNNNGLLDDPGWSAFHLWSAGAPVAANAALCPRTMAALARVPTCRISGRTPIALFSLLRPGVHIPPHHGFLNTRLICHLPLIVPPDCALRVGNETRPWREGELVIFDDTMEHEAWNRSSQLRVVLLFDIWRPELSEQERALVAATLESIDRLGGARRQWTQ